MSTAAAPAPQAPSGARDRVLAAADQLFYERGIHAVGVNEIVRRAGVAKTSMYLHFDSKDLLVASYLQGRVDAYRAEWEALLARTQGEPAPALLDAIFDVLTLFVAGEGFRGCPFVNAAAEICEPDHPARAPIDEYRLYVRDRLMREVAERAGAADPAGLAEKLQLLYDAALAGSVMAGNGIPLARARETGQILLAVGTRV
jgi:AcrR family transcriptional regulator